MRRVLLLVSLIGVAIFGVAFCISFVDPLIIERAAREVVRIEVEKKVGEKVESLSNSRLVAIAQKALRKTDAEIDLAKREIAEEIPRKVARVVTDMLNADCECRQRLAKFMVTAQEEKITAIGQVREHLVRLIESSYKSVTTNLMTEFRIFTASNAAAFALLAIVTYFRRGAAVQLVLPAVVLVGAVAISGSLYLFNQNWLHTVLYSQYVGFAYTGYLGLAAAFLADVVFNRARITTALVNISLNLVGSAVQAVPC